MVLGMASAGNPAAAQSGNCAGTAISVSPENLTPPGEATIVVDGFSSGTAVEVRVAVPAGVESLRASSRDLLPISFNGVVGNAAQVYQTAGPDCRVTVTITV